MYNHCQYFFGSQIVYIDGKVVNNYTTYENNLGSQNVLAVIEPVVNNCNFYVNN
jgi:hypothetical protein